MLYMPVVEVQGKEVLPKPLEFEEREEIPCTSIIEKSKYGFHPEKDGAFVIGRLSLSFCSESPYCPVELGMRNGGDA